MRGILVTVLFLLGVAVVSPVEAGIYQKLKVGKLEGKVTVQWLEPNVFLFIPDAERPLTFTRSNGEKIQPGRLITDGGSIPRPMWVFRNYSPWGYAPAFIVHDWIFYTKHCG